MNTVTVRTIVKVIFILSSLACLFSSCGNRATIREEVIEMNTYPFDDPDPVPRPKNLCYPYFRFDGYSHQGQPQDWNTVVLENRHIVVTIIPSIGGKIWGAIEKSVGEEFIYYNDVVKFRNIAMRGPCTAGGIELNFGIIGHAPTTATPVDYLTRKNDDGSVSCFVGSFDMITRTWWQVEINLQPDCAFFTTSTTWRNTTPFPRPYGQWMNAGYRASDDLHFVFPGQYYIGHGGDVHSWKFDEKGRDLSRYFIHSFGGTKSMYVLGNYNDFYAAYYEGARFGSVHYSPFNDKMGMKIFLWGLSRAGMIWEDLLTDINGQYVELQSGRLYNQAGNESIYTPFKQYSFNPYAVDRWMEYWYPVKEIGSIVKANDIGAINMIHSHDAATISFSPAQPVDDDIVIWAGDREIFREHLSLETMQTWQRLIMLDDERQLLKVVIGDDRLVYSESSDDNKLSRPVVAPSGFDHRSAFGLYLQAQQRMNENNYDEAIKLYLQSLDEEPYSIYALRDLGMIYCWRGLYDKADSCARLILSINAYDPDGNLLYGLVNSKKGKTIDAIDGFKTAALSPSIRAAAYICLAKESAKQQQWSQMFEHAQKSFIAGGNHGEVLQLLALALRKQGSHDASKSILAMIEQSEPLNHYIRFERYMFTRSDEDLKVFQDAVRCELPDETFMEMAGWYESIGCFDEAVTLYRLADDYPIAWYRLAYLHYCLGDKCYSEMLERAESFPIANVFPFRVETMPALEWAVESSTTWKGKYYLSILNAFLGNERRASNLLEQCGDVPDDPIFYLLRAQYRVGDEQLNDLRRAESFERTWRVGFELVRYFQTTGQYDLMYDEAREYVELFPENDILGLKYATAMINLKKYRECTEFLADLRVLSGGGDDESRTIYRKAWLFCALENMKSGAFKDALFDVEQSKTWPENLGVGKPYDEDIDLTVENFITSYCNAKLDGSRAPTFDAVSTCADDDDIVKELIRLK
jgi:tetratricopeptide (TPR) repeat protein